MNGQRSAAAYLIFSFLFITILFWAGCGPPTIVINTAGDEAVSHESFSASRTSIIYVKDSREQDPKLVGHITGQVGGKRADVYLPDSLSIFIKNYLNSLPGDSDRTFPVSITINAFSLVENYSKKDEYHLFGSLSFRYTDGSGLNAVYASNINSDFSRDEKSLSANIKTALKESFGGFIAQLDIQKVPPADPERNVILQGDSQHKGIPDTDSIITGPQTRHPQVIPYLRYDTSGDSTHKEGSRNSDLRSDSAAVPREGTEPGTTEVFDTDSYSPELSYPDSTPSRIIYDEAGYKISDSSLAEQYRSGRSNIVFDEPVTVPEIKRAAVHLGAGMSYYTGSKITGGMQIEFRMSWQKPDWEYGYSVGFLYVNFITSSYEGSLWALNMPWNMKYMLKDDIISPYLGGTIKLIAGRSDENGKTQPNYFDNSGNVGNNYFWGPTFEESIGLSIDRSLFIEGGIYEMFLFGTNILPDDIGFRLSLHFTVKK